jgi:hypothetical protein
MRRAERGLRPATARLLAGACLAGPFVGLLPVPLYASEAPRLAGLPFFYWYQFAWVPLSALLTAMAYRLLRRAGAADTPGRAPD